MATLYLVRGQNTGIMPNVTEALYLNKQFSHLFLFWGGGGGGGGGGDSLECLTSM